MKKITVLIAAVAMTLGLQLQACNANNTTGKAAETTSNENTTTAVTPAVTEEVVEEFTASSTWPETITEPLVIDFNADWCGPCQRFKPVFHKLARDYKGKARFISVNVDNNGGLARQFRVSSIPQISIVKTDGSVVSTVGAMDEEQFRTFLNDNL